MLAGAVLRRSLRDSAPQLDSRSHSLSAHCLKRKLSGCQSDRSPSQIRMYLLFMLLLTGKQEFIL